MIKIIKSTTLIIFFFVNEKLYAQEEVMIVLHERDYSHYGIYEISSHFGYNLYLEEIVDSTPKAKIISVSETDFPLTIKFTSTVYSGYDSVATYQLDDYKKGYSIGLGGEYTNGMHLYSPHENIGQNNTSIGICETTPYFGSSPLYQTDVNPSWSTFPDGSKPSIAGENFRGNLRIKAYRKALKDSSVSNSIYTTMELKTITLNVVGCAPPQKADYPLPNNAKCFGEAGSIDLFFDKQIDVNQKILLNIIDAEKHLSSRTLTYQYLNANANKYTWTGIAKGIHTIKYQAIDMNDNKNEVSGSTVITYPSLTISEPPDFNYTVTFESPLCNGQAGEITINASGGTGDYSYTLDGSVEKPSFTKFSISDTESDTRRASRTVTVPPFTNTKNFYIKVIDGNGCIDEKYSDK